MIDLTMAGSDILDVPMETNPDGAAALGQVGEMQQLRPVEVDPLVSPLFQEVSPVDTEAMSPSGKMLLGELQQDFAYTDISGQKKYEMARGDLTDHPIVKSGAVVSEELAKLHEWVRQMHRAEVARAVFSLSSLESMQSFKQGEITPTPAVEQYVGSAVVDLNYRTGTLMWAATDEVMEASIIGVLTPDERDKLLSQSAQRLYRWHNQLAREARQAETPDVSPSPADLVAARTGGQSGVLPSRTGDV